MATFTFQWQRGNATGTGGWANIPGAVFLEYDPVDADIGSTLRCRVTCINSAGNTTAFSTPSSPITAGGSAGDQPTGDYWDVTYGEGDLREWDGLEANPPLATTTPTAYGTITVTGPLNIKSGEGVSAFTGKGSKPGQVRVKSGKGVAVFTGHAPSPPSVWYGVNVIANHNFSNGLTGWSAAPPSAWTTGLSVPFSTSQKVAYDSGSASAQVYTGSGSRSLNGANNFEHGLYYIGGEWKPSDYQTWRLEFDWRQIAEQYTNNAPWGITGHYIRATYGRRDGTPVTSAEFTPGTILATGSWYHVLWEFQTISAFEPGGTSPYWQFSFTGWHYNTAVSADPYGWAFEVKGISLYRVS